MKPSVVQLSGAGRAYQAVAQSSAIAIQDATDYLRNVSTTATTAMGVAMALLATGDPNGNGKTIIQNTQKAITGTVENFSKIGAAAVQIARKFPNSFG